MLAARERLGRRTRDRIEATRYRLEETKNKFQETRAKVKDRIHRENIITIPNALCVARIALTPLLGYFVIIGNFEPALYIFGFAGITDLVSLIKHRLFRFLSLLTHFILILFHSWTAR